MQTIGLFFGASIFLAWLLFAVASQFVLKGKYSKSTWWTLGVVGLIFLGSLLFEHAAVWSAGHLREQLTYLRSQEELIPSFMLFELVVAIIATMNLSSRFRNNKRWQKAQIGLIILYLIGCFTIYEYSAFDYATSIIPGGHTTIYQVGNFFGILIWLVMIIGLTLARYSFSSRN